MNPPFIVSMATRERAVDWSPPRWAGDVELNTVHGFSDVALARCVQIAHVLRRPLKPNGAIVFVDDDICVSLKELCELARECRQGDPVSAQYCPRGLPAMLTHNTVSVLGVELTLAGLGACAIARSDLLELSRCSTPIQIAGATAVTWSGPHRELGWLSEDYRLWVRLWATTGARVRMLPWGVLHGPWWPEKVGKLGRKADVDQSSKEL